MRKAIAIVAGLIVLAFVNVSIFQRERLLEDGRIVLLELAPVDPRSLMQGDYMALRFQVVNSAGLPKTDGHLVLAVDERGVGSFVRLHRDEPLAEDEMLLRYRVRNEEVKLATNAFFFQEGQAELFESARYGEFRVDADGEAILTGLRDADLAKLGATSGAAAGTPGSAATPAESP